MENSLALVFFYDLVIFNSAREIETFWGVGFVEIFVAFQRRAGVEASFRHVE
jgi:hypothetical protein